MKILWTVDAEQDRERIYDYLDERNPIAAIELDDLIRKKLVCLPIIILWGELDKKNKGISCSSALCCGV
jgi:hypothetical protein